MIFAYGLLDPTINGNRTTITYHSPARRGSRIIPLQSYANPPADSKFDGLDSFDFRLANVSLVDHRRLSRILSFQYSLPPQSTTYHCKIHRVPTRITGQKQAIAVCIRSNEFALGNESWFQHKMLLDPANVDIVHHLLMYECDPKANFNDSDLPEGECDTINAKIQPCAANIASGWAIGGDEVSVEHRPVSSCRQKDHSLV